MAKPTNSNSDPTNKALATIKNHSAITSGLWATTRNDV